MAIIEGLEGENGRISVEHSSRAALTLDTSTGWNI
jgi:hypothetical protein